MFRSELTWENMASVRVQTSVLPSECFRDDLKADYDFDEPVSVWLKERDVDISFDCKCN